MIVESRLLIISLSVLFVQEHERCFTQGKTELVHLQEIRPERTKRSVKGDLPHQLAFSFHAHGQLFNLKLKKNMYIDVNSPLCLLHNNETICFSGSNDKVCSTDLLRAVLSQEVALVPVCGALMMRQNFGLYKDAENNAAISVEVDQSLPSHLQRSLLAVNGEYVFENIYYEIKAASPALRLLTQKNLHYVVRRAVSKTRQSVQVRFPANPLKESYWVELLILIDHSIFNKFTRRNNSSLEGTKSLRYYFAHIANAIDLRFSGIDARDFTISVRLSGYYILKDIADTPFLMTSRRIVDGKYKLDGLAALAGLKRFLQSKKNLPVYDHAMFFTDYETFNIENRILGSTFAAGICSDSRASLIVDHGAYTSAGTASHELAHNLGVTYHDGDGDARGCSSEKHYIMSPSVAVLNSSTKEYGFKFSTCSVSQLRAQLASLGDRQKNCLSNFASTKNEAEFSTFMELLPGQMEDVHGQCRHMYGPQSFMCPPSSPSEICYKMLCYVPGTKRCVAKSEQKAALGTPCGHKKWCVLGNCVANSTAVSAPDDCPYPDLPALVDCSKASPAICRDKRFYKRCCHSCNQDFSSQQSCQDAPITIYSLSCAEFVKKYGTIYCQHDQNITEYCCSSCKELSKPRASARVSTGACSDRADIKLNGMNCHQFVAQNGNRVCGRQEVRDICCGSCAP